jgi:hypothetical protein
MPIDLRVKRVLYKHLRKVRDAAIECGFDGRKLRKLGFKKEDVGGHSQVKHIYVSKKLGVVIKFPYFMRWQIVSIHCVPTVFTPNPRYKTNKYKVGKYAVIQPLVDVTKFREAEKELQRLGADSHSGDFHKGNVGHYNGTAVLIDW